MPDYSEFLTPERLAIEDESWGRTRQYARNGQAVIDTLERIGQPVHVVEFGAGTGWLALFVLKNASEYVEAYTAIDKHPDEVRLIRQRLSDICTRKNVEAQQWDVREWLHVDRQWQPDVTCCFAFLKHFGRNEWETIIRGILASTKLFSLFELNVSPAGEYLDTGPTDESGTRHFPCLSVPNDEVLRIVADEGFKVIERTVFVSGPQGWETLFICERVK